MAFWPGPLPPAAEVADMAHSTGMRRVNRDVVNLSGQCNRGEDIDSIEKYQAGDYCPVLLSTVICRVKVTIPPSITRLAGKKSPCSWWGLTECQDLGKRRPTHSLAHRLPVAAANCESSPTKRHAICHLPRNSSSHVSFAPGIFDAYHNDKGCYEPQLRDMVAYVIHTQSQ